MGRGESCKRKVHMQLKSINITYIYTEALAQPEASEVKIHVQKNYTPLFYYIMVHPLIKCCPLYFTVHAILFKKISTTVDSIT